MRYRFGNFELDLVAEHLLLQGETVPLKPKVFLLLQHLVEHRDRLVSRNELMDQLWPNQDIADSNLTQSVYELRKALNSKKSNTRYIETVARRGFRFSQQVEEVAGDDTSTTSSQIRSIAVLPFAALPGAERDEALELGISDVLVIGLCKIPGLKVIQVRAPSKYSEPGRDGLAAGHELRVEVVLDGSLQREGNRLRVTARLVRVSEGDILWAEKFEQAFTDIFTVEDALCDRVINAIDARRPRGKVSKLLERRPHDVEVHELYLRCRYYWLKWTPEAWMKSIECGKEGIRRDPLHAPSHSWTGASYCTLAMAGVLPPKEGFAKGEALVKRAIELDDSHGDAYEMRGAIGFFHHWNWVQAEADLTRSFELNPSGSSGRGLFSLLLSVLGRFDDALFEARRAREIEPLSLIVNTTLGEAHYYRREYEQAVEALEHVSALDRYFPNSRLSLGLVLAAQGQYAESLREMETAVEYMKADPDEFAHVGYARALIGDTEGAARVIERLKKLSMSQYIDPFGIALVNMGLGDFDAVFSWIDAAVEARSPELVYVNISPVFDNLRTEPRFPRVLKRIGLDRIQITAESGLKVVGQD